MRICPICCAASNTYNITNLTLSLVNDINLNNTLNVKFCKECNFYFSDSNNTQEDYNNYYLKFNNYQQQVYCPDKDQRCANFIFENINRNENKTLLDYGTGNGVLANLLSKEFSVEMFDIDMEKNTKKYDLLVLSHVLEHIYDVNNFIKEISKNIKEDKGLLYIEIPNADFYKEFTNICPLQEVNIEHINFFSKYALNKLLVNNGFSCVNMIDDYFMIKNSKYFVIRGIFEKVKNSSSFETYVDQGLKIINSYNFELLKKYENVYIYGCGQFLFKIFDKIQNNVNIINIIDDNPCYLNKKIKNINIINYELFQQLCKNEDNVLLTTMIHDEKIKQKLILLNKKINIININNLK
jgi:SAM-dependent methyltransferase